MPQWPRQSECVGFYGNPRDANFEDINIVDVYPPFQLVYDDGASQIPVPKIRIHQKCAFSLARVLLSLWLDCSKNPTIIKRFGAHIFSGSYVNRPMRSASILSMHAYGCAVDFNASANPYNHGPADCLFNRKHPLVEAFLDEGWVWGGDWHLPRDAMHFQAARVG